MHSEGAQGGELSPGTEIGGYVVQAKIGEGGMGTVYGAQHPSIGKRVAIKVLAPAFSRDPSTALRFEQEARLVNEVHHANIVDIFQLGELPDGRKYLVMEWLEGESLTDRIDRGPIPAREAVEILDAVCDAMQAVHDKGVIHRDLKSDNVFLATLRGQRKVKLLDFGLAKLAGANNPKAITKTKTGMIVGTPAYMAPEQARGQPVDHRTDVYGLGVLTYKMLTARLPFVGDSPMDLIIQHVKKPPPSPRDAVPDVPDALAQVVVRMMAKAPADRPSLADVRLVLAALREGRTASLPSAPTTATPDTASTPSAIEAAAAPAPPARRAAPRVLVGVAVLLALLVAAGAVLLAR